MERDVGKETLPERKLLRMKGYDYSQNGAYFVTVCTHARAQLFGKIIPLNENTDVSNQACFAKEVHTGLTKDRHGVRSSFGSVGATLCGRPHHPDLMIEKWLLETENKFPGIKLDCYCVMPDHVHFILCMMRDGAGDHTGSPLQNNTQYDRMDDRNQVSLFSIINWFKTMTTNEYIKGIKTGIYSPFQKRLWQRGYYEHIIRGEDDLYETRRYILENPQRWLIRNQGEKRL